MTDDYPSIPTTIRQAVRLVCVLTGISAAGLIVFAAIQPLLGDAGKPAWILVGFEAVVLAASVLGWVLARDRFREGPGLALACIAGSILVGSALGGLSAQWGVGPIPLKLLLAARGLGAMLLAGLGGWMVLARDPRAWPVFVKGLIAASPILALIAWFGVKGGAFLDPVLSLSAIYKFAALGVGGIVLAFSLCAGVHLIVKAFAFGRFAQDEVAPGIISGKKA